MYIDTQWFNKIFAHFNVYQKISLKLNDNINAAMYGSYCGNVRLTANAPRTNVSE